MRVMTDLIYRTQQINMRIYYVPKHLFVSYIRSQYFGVKWEFRRYWSRNSEQSTYVSLYVDIIHKGK